MVQATMTCGKVNSSIRMCLPWIRRKSIYNTPSPDCCASFRGLNSEATAAAECRTLCGCLKSAAGSISGFNPENARLLPDRCGVTLPYKFSTSANCKA
ncbi:hypothetical protein PIB30_073480, partial [Stylosanthes scabra]|nr:hypothetical protein [Stylosanthes scabra]